MSKLFEIPIYAFSPKTHRKRVDKYKAALRQEYRDNHEIDNPKHMNEWIYLICHPYQLWEYNHIVGYIVISYNSADVSFDLYLQAQGLQNKTRYHWRSNQKWLLENQSVGGWHFPLDNKYSSDEIREKIHSWLDGMITELVPSKYYVDREAFDTVDRMMDYRLLLKGE